MHLKTSFGLFGIEANKYGICSISLPNNPKKENLKNIEKLVDIKNHLLKAKKQLEEYFNGDRKVFNLRFNLFLQPSFHLDVLKRVHKIPYGKTISYKDIASDLNNKNAFRTVGSANARNPIPIIIPCYRVILSNGESGDYGGGKRLKKKLINHERNYQINF